MTGAGLRALVLPRPLPTPLLAFAIRDLGCVAGVMVTASHNPPQDNGYKVYLGDGSQIVPPADDRDRRGASRRWGRSREIPRGDGRGGPRRGGARPLPARPWSGSSGPAGPAVRPVVVYTPLHGVGGRGGHAGAARGRVRRTPRRRRAGRAGPRLPHRGLPQPRGARGDGPRAGARRGGGRRPRGGQRPGRRPVRRRGPGAARLGDAQRRRGRRPAREHLLAWAARASTRSSIVSSSLLGKMAAAGSQLYAETLTGFKWIGRVEHLAFGYEEALGYCVDPAHVRDKDGISRTADGLRHRRRGQGSAVARCATCSTTSRGRFGLHATDQLSVRMDDLAAIPAVVDRLREDPPTSLGGLAVERVDDLSAGSADLPPTNGLRLTGWPTAAASSYARRGPSRSSSATSRSWSPWRTRRTASTPRGSPRSVGSTRSAPTCSAAAGLCSGQFGTAGRAGRRAGPRAGSEVALVGTLPT